MRERTRMIERITEEFFNTGLTLDEYLAQIKTEEQNRTLLYYKRCQKNCSPKDLRIDLEYPVNLIAAGCGWCWDCQTNIPVLVHLAEQSPNINLRIFNKDHLPFLVDQINGGEKVPQVLVFSQDFYFLDRWVERTTYAYQLSAKLRKKHGWKKENFDAYLKDYRTEYIKNHKILHNELIREFRELLKRTDAIQGTTARYSK